jgi:Na+-transporting NADH:ubiquinone oxidoreductase subunit C
VSNKDSVQRTLIVAFLLCLVCSVIVSVASVWLKPLQVANKSLDFKRNILAVAGLLKEGIPIDEQFKQITVKLVDLETGKYTGAVNPEKYDQRKAGKNPEQSDALSSSEDIAKILRREKYAKVYLVESQNTSEKKQGYSDQKTIDKIILPIRGYGLWSTLYGFIALEKDFNTVAGLGFYEHAETPGLGGEVDNPGWKALWQGKKIYEGGNVALEVIKGKVTENTKDKVHKIDGLSGATLTTSGVNNLIKFWMGDMGYAKFLSNLKGGEA